MNVTDIRLFAARHLTGLLAATSAAGASRTAAPASPVGGPKAPAPRPTMELEHWGTILDVSPARVGDRFTLGRLRFRTDDGVEATFTLSALQDASFVVIAEGDSPMTPITSGLPWAASSAILLDLAEDGWTAPLPKIAR